MQPEVIEFRDSYVAPKTGAATDLASEGTATKKGRTIAITTEDMQKRMNDVKARTTLLLALPDEHHLRFSNLTPEWLMHIIVWRNRSDLDTMSLDDLYNHLKVYESEVQMKSESNSQNMAFISLSKNSSGNEEVNTASIPTTSTNVFPASISLDTACAYIASQSNGSQIKYEDINQIDEDDIEEMVINQKWSALTAIRWATLLGSAGLPETKTVEGETTTDKGLRIENLTNELETLKKEKEGLESKLTVLSPPPAQVYSPPKKDMSWTGLPKFVNDTITNYTRPSPSVESNPNDLQHSSSSAFENGESTGSILSKLKIKFMRPADSPTVVKTDKKETVRKPTAKYAELYRKTSVRSNACYNCGGVDHLSYNYDKWVDHGRSWAKNNNTHKSRSPKTVIHKPNRSSMRPTRPNMNAAQPKWTSFYKPAHAYVKRAFQRRSASGTQFQALRVPTVNRKFPTDNRKFPTVNRKFPTGNTKFSIADLGNKGKARRLGHLNFKTMNRCDNRGEFRNKEMNDFCLRKGIKREFSNAKTPQQNGVTKRRNRTLIEVARTILADAKLPVTFWAEAVNTACYESLMQKGIKVTLLGILCLAKHLGYSIREPRELKNLHVDFLENKAIEKGTKDAASHEVKKDVSSLRYIALPNWFHEALLESSSSNAQDTCNADAPKSSGNPNPTATTINPLTDQMETLTVETPIPTVSLPVLTACFEDSPEPSSTTRIISKRVTSQDVTPSLDNISTLANRFDDILRVTTSIVDSHREEADVSNMETTITSSPTPTLRIHKDHPKIYQIDVKSALLYGTIDEEVYVMQPPGFQDPKFPARVYKVEKAIEFEAFMHKKFQMSAMGELNFFLGLQVLQKEDGISLSQDKYVGDILKKFGYSDVRSANTPMDKENPWGKDKTGKDVDLHLYRSMIGSLMYLSASRPNIMFATIMTSSTTEAEYVAAASGCGQVLWIQNQLLDYGYNFMNTKIYIDNNSAICIVKNPVYHSKTKHIEIRHHFIRDCFEKKLINVDHIHTDENVTDLLTKLFDAERFQYLVVEHAMRGFV
nr:hypothetical protein [Tanacetum cinerariifolium]